jgi:hypothetical protein
MNIAKGFEKLSLNLEQHIRFYTPSNWVVPISNVAYTPIFSAKEVKIFMEAYKLYKLKSTLEELGQDKKYPYNQLNQWYIREAIEDFFSKKVYSSYENEL